MRVGASSSLNSDEATGHAGTGVTRDCGHGTAAGNSRLPVLVSNLLLEFRMGRIPRSRARCALTESVARTTEFYGRRPCKSPSSHPLPPQILTIALIEAIYPSSTLAVDKNPRALPTHTHENAKPHAKAPKSGCRVGRRDLARGRLRLQLVAGQRPGGCRICRKGRNRQQRGTRERV